AGRASACRTQRPTSRYSSSFPLATLVEISQQLIGQIPPPLAYSMADFASAESFSGSLTHQIQTWVSRTITARRPKPRQQETKDLLPRRNARCRADRSATHWSSARAGRPLSRAWSRPRGVASRRLRPRETGTAL